MHIDAIDMAVKAAWEEILSQVPESMDFSTDHGKPAYTVVFTFDAFNLRKVVEAALLSAARTP